MTERGYDLSLRQLHYQLVGRGHVNTKAAYESLGDLVANARMAGYIDWNSITDRTRVLQNKQYLYHGELDINIIEAVKSRIERCFSTQLWSKQPYYIEVWVEKDALIDVIGKAAKEAGTPYFACKGNPSVDALHDAAMRFKRMQEDEDKICRVVYCGDHDPSGINIPRSIAGYMKEFRVDVTIERIALNLDQIRALNLPPNTAKEADKLYKRYVAEFGIKESWEIDALPPQYIHKLITDSVNTYFDEDIHAANIEEMLAYKSEMWEKHQPILELLREQAS
jgi:hypothetical protein